MHIVSKGKGAVHRRRINSEEKAKVVAAAWRTEFIPILAAPAMLHQEDDFILFFKSSVQFILFFKLS